VFWIDCFVALLKSSSFKFRTSFSFWRKSSIEEVSEQQSSFELF